MRENYLKNFFESKKPKIIATIAIIIILLMAAYYIAIWQLQEQVKTSYDNLQKECSNQAKNVANNIQNAARNIQYSHTSHYSSNLRACYVLLHGDGLAGIGTTDKLIDLSANKNVASCESYSTAPSLDNCVYNGSTGTYNLDNFKEFIKSYMETK